jgi:hypothetical protein
MWSPHRAGAADVAGDWCWEMHQLGVGQERPVGERLLRKLRAHLQFELLCE